MGARRLRLTMAASLCGLVCVVGVGVVPTVAGAATHFGGFGEEAEQLRGPKGVAVGPTGEVYLGDTLNNRVDKFDSSGNFLLAWGSGVATGANEMQTCTIASGCEGGSQYASPEAFELPAGVAVDNDPSSLSYGDVYVVDRSHGRVQKYDSSGKFILMFGGHVNETTGGDVCMAGETCNLYGTQGVANGEFSHWESLSSFIAVGPGGDVYVGDTGRVEVFEPSGTWKENISLAGLSATDQPTALAVDAAGDVYVKDSGVAGVHEFEANGTEKSTIFDEGSTSVTALSIDAAGNLYVGDSNGGFHVLKYGPTGKELDSFGSKTVTGSNEGLAFSDTTDELYAPDVDSGQVWVLSPPAPGPLVDGESVVPGLRGEATFEATVNPEGNEPSYYFQYVDEAQFKASGYADATSTVSSAIASAGFEDQSVSTNLPAGTLLPGTTYHYRVVATNSQARSAATIRASKRYRPARITGPWASDVANTSATLAATIDPLGASTSYHMEYGTSIAYGQVLVGSVGEGMGAIPVTRHIQNLESGTIYHYRIVTTSEVGTVEGADHTFTTQALGGELTLPDGRAWELVSPADKHGALIEPEISGAFGDTQAATDGSGVTYLASEPITGKPPTSRVSNQVLTMRGPDGWQSTEIGISPELRGKEGERPASELLFGAAAEDPYLFSPDLSLTVMEPGETSPLLGGATERTIYLHDNLTGAYTPLVTPANVPEGTKFGGINDEEGQSSEMRFVTTTPDLSHIVLASRFKLTPEAIETGTITSSNLYEWSAGQLQLVNILPDNEAADGGYLGRSNLDVLNALSDDGRWAVWSTAPTGSKTGYTLYVRDMVAHKTIQVGGRAAIFETMSSDGSLVFFLEHGELYDLDTTTGTQTDLTIHHGAGERTAGVQDGVIGVSEDGKYVYFVATGVLASGAVSGEDNLYLLHETGSGWVTSHLATLSDEDQPDWYNNAYVNAGAVALEMVTSRVTPDGRYLTFMSNRPLTGYDNTDALSGQPDEEVYLYDAQSARLVCASCNPTGARPHGIFDSTQGAGPMVDRQKAWGNHWLAANIPGRRYSRLQAVYQTRFLSSSGRLFFTSSDALVPLDTNGLEDVYEYEPAGIGSCTSASTGYNERLGGCVSLISSGTYNGESAFLDASESGDDVFFVTGAKLTTEDYDASNDVYDAHVCTTAVPCVAAPVSPPPCTSGDSCKAAPSPQPAIFGAAPSATFSGIGNVAEEVKSVVKPKKKKKKAKPKRHAKKKRHKAKKARGSRAGKATRRGK